MAQIIATYFSEPDFPPSMQQPGATRTLLGTTWCDALGGTATQADLDAYNAAALAPLQREQTFAADPNRSEIVTHLRNDTLAQIEAYVRGKINADAVTDLASAKLCMQRIENAMAGLTQTVALVVRK